MRLLRIQFKGAVFKGIVKVLALAACLISLCAVSACASGNLPTDNLFFNKKLLKVAKKIRYQRISKVLQLRPTDYHYDWPLNIDQCKVTVPEKPFYEPEDGFNLIVEQHYKTCDKLAHGQSLSHELFVEIVGDLNLFFDDRERDAKRRDVNCYDLSNVDEIDFLEFCVFKTLYFSLHLRLVADIFGQEVPSFRIQKGKCEINTLVCKLADKIANYNISTFNIPSEENGLCMHCTWGEEYDVLVNSVINQIKYTNAGIFLDLNKGNTK